MIRFNKFVGGLAVLGLAMMVTPAHANLQVKITDAAGTQTFTDAGHPGTILVSTTDTDFVIQLDIATSNSPGTNVATLHIDTIFEATTAGVTAGGNLTVAVSDDAFTQPIGSDQLTESVNTNDISGSTTGSVTFQGYEINGANLFGTGANTTGPKTFNNFAVTNNGVTTGGPFTSTNPFTLTEMTSIHATNTGEGQATANLVFGNVPEPSSIMLMGTIVLGLTAGFRKKLKRS
jgi:hypothetical protein